MEATYWWITYTTNGSHLSVIYIHYKWRRLLEYVRSKSDSKYWGLYSGRKSGKMHYFASNSPRIKKNTVVLRVLVHGVGANSYTTNRTVMLFTRWVVTPHTACNSHGEMDPVWYTMEMKRKVVAYAMKRIAAGAHIQTPWLFEPTKRPDDRLQMRTRGTRFHFSEVGRALWANSGERAAQWALPVNWAT